MNLVEWLVYAAACKTVAEIRDVHAAEDSLAARVVVRGAVLRGFRYVPGALDMPATSHVHQYERNHGPWLR